MKKKLYYVLSILFFVQILPTETAKQSFYHFQLEVCDASTVPVNSILNESRVSFRSEPLYTFPSIKTCALDAFINPGTRDLIIAFLNFPTDEKKYRVLQFLVSPPIVAFLKHNSVKTCYIPESKIEQIENELGFKKIDDGYWHKDLSAS
jgi:hypothetical protein